MRLLTYLYQYSVNSSRLKKEVQQLMNDEQIKHMVDRFLAWYLPENFNPDDGISFDPIASKGTSHEFRRTPQGTNLFDAQQATAMVRHMLEGIPTEPQAVQVPHPHSSADIVEAIAKWLHEETDHPDSYPDHTWPETDRDDGRRESGWVKIVPQHAQAYFRDIARRMVARFPLNEPQTLSVREAAIEECAKIVEPKGERPCDCERCYCGNHGDLEAVAAWDADAANAKAIRALALSRPKLCSHEAIIGLDGKWHCQRCGDAMEMSTASEVSSHQLGTENG